MRRLRRRQVLAAMAALPVIGGLCGGALTLRWWDRAPGAGLAALSEREHAFVQAIAEAWLPRGGQPELSGADANIGDFIDAVAAAMPPNGARELKLLLAVLDDLTLPTHRATFHTLDLPSRSAVVASWLAHERWLLRNAANAVLVLVAEGYTLHPDVLPLLRPHFRCGFGP